MPHPSDIDWMVTRGWSFETLQGMSVTEFNYRLRIAVETVKRENEEQKKAMAGHSG